jgi:hypothetical protein
MIQKELQKQTDKEKFAKEREQAMQMMKESGSDGHKNILFPKYVFDERIKMMRESKPKPPSTLYYEIGYDKIAPENPEQGNKHYRRFYDDELENIKEIFPRKAFHSCDIVRG